MISQFIIDSPLISLFLITVLVTLLSYLYISKKQIARYMIESENGHNKQLKFYQYKIKTLQQEIELLDQQLKKHIDYVINIPEAVKSINSTLLLDDLITSVIRLVRKLIDTNEIEIYSFDKDMENLMLIAALGTNRGTSIKVKPGEGVVGGAAATKMTFVKAQMKMDSANSYDEKLEMASPIIFKKEIFGVIGIGKRMSTSEYDKSFLALIADLAAVAFKNCESLEEAKEGAIKDVLTGLYNRRYFFDKGQEVIAKSTDYDSVFSIFIFDIDNFKNYNDVNGHLSGDALLKELAELLRDEIRSPDIAARYGGEEFIVLFHHMGKQAAHKYAEKMRERIETHTFVHREKQPLGFISISGGLAEFPVDGKSINELIEYADKALYKSKKTGKNRITIFSSDQYLPGMSVN